MITWPKKSSRSWWRVPLCCALAVPCASAWPAEPSWPDIESRIQYGYFTEDTRSLRALLEPLSGEDSGNGLKSYYAGLLSYRLTELAQAGAASAAGKPPTSGAQTADKSAARQMAGRCVEALDRALALRSDFADALALQSACLGELAELGSWRAPLAAQKSASQLRKALQAAPQNPRVLLLEAVHEYQHAKVPAGDAEQACGKFRKTAETFEAERAQVDQVPGWGAAEAYTWLGRCYLDSGETVMARDALERALLIAPEFGQARRLLTTITSG
ncbi:MAG TPA: tetratricopeptide repeat protein [Steroidobacteraceae bacterium]|nr:tetratricopeptide repeat protein [Steroidobacteraceae bacterium]